MKIVIIALIQLYSFYGLAQSGLKVSDGAQLKLVGQPYLVLENEKGNLTIDSISTLILDSGRVELAGDWINRGQLLSDKSTVTMNGQELQTIHNQTASFYNLHLENNKNVMLKASTSVANEVHFINGSLETGDTDTLYLGETGRLINESDGNYLVGHVQSQTLVNNGTTSPGNIGLELHSDENLGMTTFLRSSGLLLENSSYAINVEDYSASIDRMWTIQPTFQPLYPIQYTFKWLPENDNNLSLTSVQAWHKALTSIKAWHNALQWDTVGIIQNGEGRTITFTSNETGQFTVGHSFMSYFIPTGFTPDADGTNDIWEIPFLKAYPDAVTQVYDRVGQRVYSATGANYWDGTYQGKNSPTGAYYYIIDLNNGTEVHKGNVNIIRLKK